MKKTVLRILTGCMVLCMVFMLLCPAGVKAEETDSGQELIAREDGSFRVLLIADTQDTDKPQQQMLELLNAELDNADADLVIFLGDVIYGPSIGNDAEKAEAAIRAVVDPVDQRGIPFAVAFGNHDDQDCISKEEQLAIYQSYPGCLNEDPDLPGVGNTCLQIKGRDAEAAPLLLWIMDSGTYAEKEIGGYGYVTQEQNEWFRSGIAAYGENAPVSYVFQHIPVPQVFELIEPAAPFSKGSFCTFMNPTTKWYREKEGAVRTGCFGETPCPPKYDSGQFQSWKDCGVRAAFFGHDHTNDYVATVEKIDLIATSGIGFYSYGRGYDHGARLLILHPDKPEEYETEMVYYRDLIDKPLGFIQTSNMGVQISRIVIPASAGILLFLIVLIMVIILLRRRRRKKKGLKKKNKTGT